MKICLVTLLFTFFTGAFVHGQDIIVQKNGEEIKAKVDQILDTEIKYMYVVPLVMPSALCGR